MVAYSALANAQFSRSQVQLSLLRLGLRWPHMLLTCCAMHQAHPRRVAKVAAQIQREMGNMLISDQVWL